MWFKHEICLVVVYVMENIIFSYGHNLKIEIGGNGRRFKTGGHWISMKYFQKS